MIMAIGCVPGLATVGRGRAFSGAPTAAATATATTAASSTAWLAAFAACLPLSTAILPLLTTLGTSLCRSCACRGVDRPTECFLGRTVGFCGRATDIRSVALLTGGIAATSISTAPFAALGILLGAALPGSLPAILVTAPFATAMSIATAFAATSRIRALTALATLATVSALAAIAALAALTSTGAFPMSAA